MTEKLFFVKNSNSTYSIVTGPNPPAPVRFAAWELQRYLRQATRAELPVRDTSPGRAVRLCITPADDDRDGFTFRVRNDDLVIEGANPRSVLYGVYAFLERCVGVRFFSPDFEYVPECNKLSIPADFAWTETADFGTRTFRAELNQGPDIVDWLAKNRFNAFSTDFGCLDGSRKDIDTPGLLNALETRGMLLEPSGHGMYYFLKAGDYIADHPDWFAQVDGQPITKGNTGDNFCYSNPEAVRQFARNVLDFCRRFTNLRRISLWFGDGGAVCKCDRCRARPFMELYGDVIAQVAEIIHRDRPDIEVQQIAYNGVQIGNPFLGLEVPVRNPDLPTLFAFWGEDLGQPLHDNFDPGHQRIYGYLADFCRRSPGKLTMFSYHTDTFMNSNICPIFAPALAADFREYHRLGIRDVFLLWIPWNGENDQDMTWIAYQNAAIWGRLGWSIRFDPGDYRRDYYAATFGREQAEAGETYWNALNAALRPLLALIFKFMPYRSTDGWGNAFNREVMKWTLATDYGPATAERIERFTLAASELARLKDDTTNLAGHPHPEVRKFKRYVDHCAVRTLGLSRIFQAQAAMQAGRWPLAAECLQQALDSGMTDEKVQTQQWLEFVRKKLDLP